MQNYMERRLIGAHEAGTRFDFKKKMIGFIFAFAVVSLLPVLHLGFFYYVWTPGKPEVDREKCVCSCFDTISRGVFYSVWQSHKPEVDRNHCKCLCFDTVFRGRYEWPPSSYKHVYFNSTSITWRIWLIVVLGVLAFYECLKHLASLALHGKLRISMVLLFATSVYPHYYGWWNFFNYYNEEFYSQFWHQFFFSFTEVLSTAMVLHLCNKDQETESWKLLLILNINAMHVIVSSLDQFIVNVIHGEGQVFEALRDLGLMMPDVFHVLVCYFEIGALAQKRRISVFNLFYKEELMASVLLVILFSLLGKNM